MPSEAPDRRVPIGQRWGKKVLNKYEYTKFFSTLGIGTHMSSKLGEGLVPPELQSLWTFFFAFEVASLRAMIGNYIVAGS